MRGKYVSSSWPSRFIGLRLKSVSFEDSLFEECYFEDVTSSNTFFRNCTFINTVFYNTGKVVWPVAVRPKGWVDPEGGRRSLAHSLAQGSQAEICGALQEGGTWACELLPRIQKIERKWNVLCNSFKTTWQKHQSSLPLSWNSSNCVML